MSFASEDWRRAIRDRQHPGMFVRRHLEACVLTYLAEELRTGDVAVAGAQAYANWADQLLSPAECAALLPAFCAEVGLPAGAAGFRAQLQARLTAQAAESDAGYPDNADLIIDEQGTATLKRRRAAPPSPTALALEAELTQRMPERTLLGILARTGHWLQWWGAGNNRPMSTATASSFLNAAGTGWSLAWPERVAGVAGPLADLAALVSLGLPGVPGPLQLRSR